MSYTASTASWLRYLLQIAMSSRGTGALAGEKGDTEDSYIEPLEANVNSDKNSETEDERGLLDNRSVSLLLRGLYMMFAPLLRLELLPIFKGTLRKVAKLTKELLRNYLQNKEFREKSIARLLRWCIDLQRLLTTRISPSFKRFPTICSLQKWSRCTKKVGIIARIHCESYF